MYRNQLRYSHLQPLLQRPENNRRSSTRQNYAFLLRTVLLCSSMSSKLLPMVFVETKNNSGNVFVTSTVRKLAEQGIQMLSGQSNEGDM